MRNAHGHVCGAEHHRSKLTDEMVMMLRRLHELDGCGVRELSRRFGIPKTTVHKILTYETRALVCQPTAKDMMP